MPRGKSATSQKTKSLTVPKEEIKSDALETFPSKEKVVLDVEEREDIIATDHKLIADPLLSPDALAVPDTSEGVEADELSLDEEEIDPFGDKFEI